MGKDRTGQIFFITMGAIQNRKGSPSRNDLIAYGYLTRTNSHTGSAEQAGGENFLKDSPVTWQSRHLGQMNFSPGSMSLVAGNPIDGADG